MDKNKMKYEKLEVMPALKSPRIVEDASIDSGQRVTWDCIWFGNYPQSEVVCETDTLRINELNDSDYDKQYVTISSAQWNKIIGAAYDESGDAVVDGIKYRRLRTVDINDVEDGDSNCIGEDKDTVQYFRYEPIKWRILNVNGNDALLLSEKAVDAQRYHTTRESVTWETCTMRSWLNGYDSSFNGNAEDYTKLNFINHAFTSDERSAIKTTKVINDTYQTTFRSIVLNWIKTTKVINDTDHTGDKIFLLSENEVCNSDTAVSYGFEEFCDTSYARVCEGSAFVTAMYGDEEDFGVGYYWWWLRSQGITDHTAFVNYDGGVYDAFYVDCSGVAIRPALHLDLSCSDFYSYAGTVCNFWSEDNL